MSIKYLVGMAFLGFMAATTAFAGGSRRVPEGNSGRQMVCRSYDDGWEEHWSHSTCAECLSKHGGCNEKCYTVSYKCKAKGTGSSGEEVTFEASSDYSKSDAADLAVSRCQAAGATNCSNSYVSDCDENEEFFREHKCSK